MSILTLPARCPLCESPNACGQQRGDPTCWCYVVTISNEVLAKVPDEARGQRCICRTCAAGKQHPHAIAERLAALHRRR